MCVNNNKIRFGHIVIINEMCEKILEASKNFPDNAQDFKNVDKQVIEDYIDRAYSLHNFLRKMDDDGRL